MAGVADGGRRRGCYNLQLRGVACGKHGKLGRSQPRLRIAVAVVGFVSVHVVVAMDVGVVRV